MTYVVSVETHIPEGAPEMDPLQRAGAVAILESGLDSVEGIEGPDGMEADLHETIVAVYPGGALLRIFVDAPALEFAEEAVRSVVGKLLERSELLAEWTVDRCEVQLHPDLAQESLAAADGPDAPPDDPASRKARHAAQAAAGSGGDDYDAAADAAATRDRMLAMAAELRSFSPVMFGVLDDEDEEGDEHDFGALPEDAKLAAGALVYGMHVLVDELFQDVQTLSRERTNVAECERPFWLLDDLPERYALQYDAHFARRFLVTAIAMTTRFTNGIFGQLSCVAEELALRLLLREAKVCLDVVGLLDSGVSDALESFAANVYEDMDHEWLYDDSMDGIDESPVGEALGIAPMSIGSWFTPFNAGRYVHPYAVKYRATTVK
ncbi:hypothetical protein CG740_04925 [Streptomyces sp. CB01201]|uniref:hypothetical protein n=1 Tax=Streptomyces sp. CB01201 TaxID=2020324 RepID=UPI000C2722AC|nr:hypothetical protein [Streptomyces sp. CB01201]PJN03754.1 hypothetical protein CG740_04925 [Streptomyces sp. CB01201]